MIVLFDLHHSLRLVLRLLLPALSYCASPPTTVTMASVQTTRLNDNNNNPFIPVLDLLPKKLLLRVFIILLRPS